MKKCCCLIVMMCAVLASCSGAWAWYYDDDPASHDGSSAEKAYIIDSVESLKLMRDRVNKGTEERGKYYKLTRDLDLTAETEWEPIGYGLYGSYGTLVGGSYAFNGHFDGDGHTILVSIDRQKRDNVDVYAYAGLFGIAGNNTGNKAETSIRNLNVRGNVLARAITNRYGGTSAGGIVIYTEYTAVIDNCTFSGDVRSVHEGTGIAGAGGIADRCTDIRNCEVKAGSQVSASSATSSSVNVNSYAGGIAGEGGNIQGCTSHARITDAECRGGILGRKSGLSTLLENVYSGALWGIGNDESDEGCTYTPLSVKILTQTLTPSYATRGQRYETKLEASEVKYIAWQVISGDLPEGITLGVSGVLSGVAVSEDICRFRVRVSVPGFEGIDDTASYTLEVVAPGAPIPENTSPDNAPTDNNSGSGGGGGGGCDAGFAMVGLVLCGVVLLRKK